MRKIFNYSLEIDGIEQFLIQEVKRPEAEIGAVTHGNGNHDEKTAGGVAVSDAEIRKIKPSDKGDRWAIDWLTEAQDMNENTGKLESEYKKDVVFKEHAPNGTVLNSELWEGCWIRKVSNSDYKKGNKNENVIETAILSVDRIKPLK